MKLKKILKKHYSHINKQRQNWNKILKILPIETNKFLYAPNCLRSVLLSLKFQNNNNYVELSDNIKSLLLEYFNIYNSESFNDKINEILKWLD